MNFFASVERKGLIQNSCMKTDGDTKYRLSYWKNISGGEKKIYAEMFMWLELHLLLYFCGQYQKSNQTKW